MNSVFFCSKCLVMSTRPRVKFDKNNICSACKWSEEKKKLNWSIKSKKLLKLLTKYKKNKPYNCLVPVSGGKDGSYVAYNLKNKYKMNPLCVTVRPPLETELGKRNLNSFVSSGYQHIHISTNVKTMQKLNKIGFIEMGFPYYGWLIAIHSAVLRVACNFKIPLIFYAEDGEVEYGGDSKHKNNGIYGTDYMISNYLEAGYKKVLKKSKLSEDDLYWFTLPNKKELKKNKIVCTHMSFYENWDPYRNYLIAKKYCGLEEKEELNRGTYTNFAQNDQKLYSLHVYLMYLKFGFGRTNQDASIDVRRGAMSREQAIELVKIYDNHFPNEYLDEYLDYFQMNKKNFFLTIDKWANKKILQKINGKWIPKFKIS